jgi:hypothetical protein
MEVKSDDLAARRLGKFEQEKKGLIELLERTHMLWHNI